MTANRHQEHARRVGSFVWQTMSGRGIRCPRPEVDQALVELNAAQLAKVEDAAQLLSKGGDARDAFELLAALRSVARWPVRTACRDHRIDWRADVMLQAACGASAGSFNKALAVLMQPQPGEALEAAVSTLRDLCGSLEGDAAAEPLPELAAPPVAETPVAATRGQGRAAAASPPPDRALPRQVKVFCSTGALTIEHIALRDGTGTTLIIEAASKTAGTDRYDWSSKIAFQLTLRELPQFFALLMGWHDAAVFKFHGGNHNKSLTADHQEHGLYLTIGEASRKIGVPVQDPDRYALATLALSAMAINEPHLNALAVLEVARATLTAPGSLRNAPAVPS